VRLEDTTEVTFSESFGERCFGGSKARLAVREVPRHIGRVQEARSGLERDAQSRERNSDGRLCPHCPVCTHGSRGGSVRASSAIWTSSCFSSARSPLDRFRSKVAGTPA